MYSDPSGFAKKTCKSKVGGECGSETNYGKSSDKINWEAVVSKKTEETRVEHVKLHESNDLSKLSHGVFYGNSQNTINNAWKNKSNGIKISEGNTDMYIINAIQLSIISVVFCHREPLFFMPKNFKNITKNS